MERKIDIHIYLSIHLSIYLSINMKYICIYIYLYNYVCVHIYCMYIYVCVCVYILVRAPSSPHLKSLGVRATQVPTGESPPTASRGDEGPRLHRSSRPPICPTV